MTIKIAPKKRLPEPPSRSKKGLSKKLVKNENSDLVPLNFRVTADFKKQMKQLALDDDLSLVKLLKKAVTLYERNR